MLQYRKIQIEPSQFGQSGAKEYLAQLLSLSRDWAEEKTCPAYYANEEADFLDKDIFVALDGERIVAYAYGEIKELTEATSYNRVGEKAFDLEELYVVPALRDRGVGKALYRFMEEQIRDRVDVIGVTAVSYQYEKLLRLYIDELGFDFKYAQLAKRTEEKR
ncbi:MAG: GNAT family N-acetyltransferase [Lachnospiraceae bacterium]|nr:GNAT family N-acetyltransferase [Lachnospiraceae bacterium]